MAKKIAKEALGEVPVVAPEAAEPVAPKSDAPPADAAEQTGQQLNVGTAGATATTEANAVEEDKTLSAPDTPAGAQMVEASPPNTIDAAANAAGEADAGEEVTPDAKKQKTSKGSAAGKKPSASKTKAKPSTPTGEKRATRGAAKNMLAQSVSTVDAQ